MGRSQVERNRIKGRPGSKGGRGRGSGGGGRGNNSNNKRRSGPDPRTLGDNAFRYERTRQSNHSRDVVDNDALLDDYHTELLLGSDYYGASHYELQEEDDDQYYHDANNSDDDDWMAVDIQALTKCLKQLPIHERLDIPVHVGKEIESRFGVDHSGGKKTLAELREESKCIVENDDVGDVASKRENNNQDSSTIDEPNNNQDSSDVKECHDDDDEDDLDAWLDDMIS